jgi:hypothetical protein
MPTLLGYLASEDDNLRKMAAEAVYTAALRRTTMPTVLGLLASEDDPLSTMLLRALCLCSHPLLGCEVVDGPVSKDTYVLHANIDIADHLEAKCDVLQGMLGSRWYFEHVEVPLKGAPRFFKHISCPTVYDLTFCVQRGI